MFLIRATIHLIANMKLILGSLCATAVAAPPKYYSPQHSEKQMYSGKTPIPIVSETNEINPDGSFSYSYATGDNQQVQAQGYLKNPGNKETEAEVIQGSYSYTSPEGIPITVTYIADELGFRAEGAHLPTPPPIPAAIQKALELIAQAQASNYPKREENFQSSSYKPKYPRPFNY